MTVHEFRGTFPDTGKLKARFSPLFARIAEGAIERERERIAPVEQIARLRNPGSPPATTC